MAKHTPGPWHVGMRQAHRIIYDTKGWAVADATVYHGKESHDEMIANARLIAEAPAMLEAMRTALEWMHAANGMLPYVGAKESDDGKQYGGNPYLNPTFKQVRTILARIDDPTTEGEEA